MIKLKGILKTIGKGILKVTDNAVLGGVVHNVIEDAKDSPKGTLDVNKLVRDLIISGLIIYGCSDKAIELFEMLY